MKSRALTLCVSLLMVSNLVAVPDSRPNAGVPMKEEFLRQKMIADWILQDAGIDHKINFKQSGENERKLVQKVLSECKTSPTVDMSNPKLAYVHACEQRRKERLKFMSAKVPSFVFVRQNPLSGSFYGYTEGQSDAQRESNFRPDTELCVMKMKNGYGVVTSLVKDSGGVIRDPEVSFDGKRLLFAWKRSHRKDDYHLYEMNLESKAIRQLTFGIGFADFEGRYLPGGDIIFSSTRGISTIPCWWVESSNLWRCDKNGKFIHRLGYDQVTTSSPSLLEDGRIVYTRWDYNDRGQTFPQPLFVMNPDGTRQVAYYGNSSWFPTTIGHAREIPGSNGKMLAILHGHHTHQKGKLAIIDPRQGTDHGKGVQMVAPRRPTKHVIVDAYGQNGDQFQYPFPISDTEFLVTYDPLPAGNRKYPRPFGIYWMDVDGHRELLVVDPKIHCKQAFPLVARKKPRSLPSQVDHSKSTAQVYMQNVYAGQGLKGIEKGTVKKLRVVEMRLRAAGVGSSSSSGPHSRAMISTPVSVGNGAWDVKMILGDVDVHEDGSALFEVPANRPIYFQALDKNNRAINTMRTWATLMPGETMSCVGCHDSQHDAPANTERSMALLAGAKSLKPFYGPARGFSYLREIQPIFDRKCVDCHDEKKAISLKSTPRSHRPEKRLWAESYLNLLQVDPARKGALQANVDGKYIKWLGSQSEPTSQPPYLRGAANSPLIKLLEGDHYKVKLTQEEMDKISAWIDLYVPYSGEYPEAGDWNDAEKKKYAHFQAKRDYMSQYDRMNRQALLAAKGSKKTVPENRETDYFDFCKKYAPESVKSFNERLAMNQAVLNNDYRNLALNADAKREQYSYPHASSNSECRGDAMFLARNVIDGDKRNTHHGKEPSWGPERTSTIPNPWIKIDFGRKVEVDKVMLTLRADFPHDTVWTSGRLEFSDGSHQDITFKKSANEQSFPFKKRTITWVRLTQLKTADRDGWAALSEIEVWGRNQ